MKRHNHLFEPICSFENLHAAAISAMRGKEGKRPAAAFFANLEEELIGLREELSFFGVGGRYYQIEYTDDLGGTWTPLGTVSPGSDAMISEYDFSAGEKRFYRIRVSDNPTKL